MDENALEPRIGFHLMRPTLDPVEIMIRILTDNLLHFLQITSKPQIVFQNVPNPAESIIYVLKMVYDKIRSPRHLV